VIRNLRLVTAALALGLLPFLFGIVSALRIFIPSVVILILVGVWSEMARAAEPAADMDKEI
jgi:hypothetical protein